MPVSTLSRARPGRSVRQSRILPYMLLFAIIGLRVASGPTAMVAYVALGLYALVGRGHAVRALALSWFLTIINPGIAAGEGAASVGRYIVLLGALISAIAHGLISSQGNNSRLFSYFSLFLGFLIIVHSVIFSPIVDVSILKAVSWALAIFSLLACWGGMSLDEREEVIGQLFWGLILLMLFSLPLAVLPAGYRVNGWGFQGLLNHPQAFGPTMGLLGAWATTRMLTERRPSWFMIGVCGLSFLFVLMSGARTAGLGMVVAVLLSIFVVPWLSGQSIRQIFPGLKSARVWGVGFVVVVAGLMASPFLIDAIESFLVKSGTGSDFSEMYEQSRGKLISIMMNNIRENTLTGIGFGINSDYLNMDVERDDIIGLPMAAPIEKGVAFLAMIEELGVVLSSVVLLWLFYFWVVAARGGLSAFAVFSVIILFNFGESTFFSPGGMGGLFLIFLTWAYAQGATKVRHA